MSSRTIRSSAQPMRSHGKAPAQRRNTMFHTLTTILALTALTILANAALFAADKHSPSPTLMVLYTFLGESDGASPNEVILDPAGNLLGAAFYGGTFGGSVCGSTVAESPSR